MSAWDDLDKADRDGGAFGASRNGGAGDQHDHDRDDDDAGDGDELEVHDVEASPVKKKNSRAKALALVTLLGVAALSVVGWAGLRVTRALSGGPVAVAPVVEQTVPADAGAPSAMAAQPGQAAATWLGSGDSVAAASPATNVAPPMAEAAATVNIAEPSPRSDAGTSGSEAPIAPALASAGADDGRVEAIGRDVAALQARLDQVEKTVGTIASSVERSAARGETRTRVVRPSQTSRPARPSARPAREAQVAAAARPDVVSRQTDKPGAGSASAQELDLSGFSLRAVYPTSGPDMMAWVVEGDRVHAVSKGSQLRGTTVVRVEVDRVVTAGGVIR